jgi:ribonucleases P/MRP protein subunit RPP40
MKGAKLEEIQEERDLGIIVQNDLKCAKQCAKVVKQANRTLGMIKRSFTHLNQQIVLLLYKSLVRPHLEYCVHVWRPHLQKDINLLECVQRRATKLIPSLNGKAYQDRLQILKLPTLENRRLRRYD